MPASSHSIAADARAVLASRSSILLAAAFLAAVSARAEEPKLVSETEFLAEIPVVLSATRLSQTRSESPAAVTVIDREMIQASGVRQIADLFRLVPGFQVGYDTGYESKVAYHGLTDAFPRRMQVLVDGRSIYSPLFGGVFWNELPLALEDIERIEVIRGPNAAVYGSNAVLATINIITRHPSQDPGTFISATTGNHETHDALARHVWIGDVHDVRLSVGYRSDDGLDHVPDKQRVPYFNLRSESRASAIDTIEVQFGVSRPVEDKGIEGDDVTVPHEVTVFSHYQQLGWRRQLGPDEGIGVRFYHNYRKLDDEYVTNPLSFLGGVRVPVNNDATEERYDLELQHTLRPYQDWRLVWGAGARLDRVRSLTWFSTPDTLDTESYRVFGNAEWRVTPATIVNAGAMVENTDISGTEVSPRIALNYHVTPQHTLRAAASRGYRTPELLEKRGNQQYFYNGVLLEQQLIGYEPLQSEVVTTVEAGYFGQAPAHHLNWDLRVYRDRLNHMVVWYSTPSADLEHEAGILQNAGSVIITGVDARIEYRPGPDTRIWLAHAIMDAEATSDVGLKNQRYREQSVPNYSSSALVSQRIAGQWFGSVVWYRVPGMRWLGDGDLVTDIERFDLRLARNFKVSESMGQAAIVVQNVSDSHYADFRPEATHDRRIFFTVAMDTH